MNPILNVQGVGKVYGGFHALRDVSFSVNPGETFAIIGPNGAGKTTLFKVITGEVAGSSGRIHLGGVDITRLPADVRVRMGMGRTFQIVRVFAELTLLENIVVAIEARNRSHGRTDQWKRVRPARDVTDEAVEHLARVGLTQGLSLESRFLSLGDRKRLELALTLAMEPQILILDEPTAGMSPSDRFAIIDLIQQTKDSLGLTILLTEHDMDFVFRLSQSLLVMNQGEKVFVGTPDEVKSNAMVQQIYLGKEMAHD